MSLQRIANATVDRAGIVNRAGLFLSSQTCRIAEIMYRQLDYWTRCGYVRPYVAADGSGTSRAYAPVEVRVAFALGRLSTTGVPLDTEFGRAVRAAIRAGENDGSWSDVGLSFAWSFEFPEEVA